MKALTIPALRHFKNGEFIHFMKQTVSACNKNGADALQLKPQVGVLEAYLPQFDDHFTLDRANALTADIEALDNRRDRAVTGIRLNAESYFFHHEESKAKAGNLLMAIFDKHGKNITRQHYNLETEIITSIVDDCTKLPEPAAAVATLGLQDWLRELASANTAFEEIYMNRSDNKAGQPVGKLPELRLAAMESYRQLTDHIFARMVLTPAPAFDTLVDKLNEVTDVYNQVVATRQANGELPTDGAEGPADPVAVATK